MRDRTDVTGLMTSESSTTTDNPSYLSDIGIMLNRYGELEIDDEVFTEALSDRFSEVALLSAGTNNQTTIGDADRGIAGDAIQTLTELMASDGTIMSQSNS